MVPLIGTCAAVELHKVCALVPLLPPALDLVHHPGAVLNIPVDLPVLESTTRLQYHIEPAAATFAKVTLLLVAPLHTSDSSQLALLLYTEPVASTTATSQLVLQQAKYKQ